MNWSDRPRTATALQKRIFWRSISLPAEATLVFGVLVGLIWCHNRLFDLLKLFEEFVVWFIENTVGTVTALFFIRRNFVYLHFSRIARVSDLFHCKFNSPNFQNVLFLNFVVLKRFNQIFNLRSFRCCFWDSWQQGTCFHWDCWARLRADRAIAYLPRLTSYKKQTQDKMFSCRDWQSSIALCPLSLRSSG